MDAPIRASHAVVAGETLAKAEAAQASAAVDALGLDSLSCRRGADDQDLGAIARACDVAAQASGDAVAAATKALDSLRKERT